MVAKGPCVLLVGGTACQPTEEIRAHRIPKERSNLDRFDRELPPMMNRSASSGPVRMVVGLVERSDATWFLKISGPEKQVIETEPVWREFFAKLKFGPDGKPIWELPEGWTDGGERTMRFATLLMNAETPPLEMSISNLGPGQERLANVNRWRGQLGLKPTTAGELNLPSVDYVGGKMLMFDETGN